MKSERQTQMKRKVSKYVLFVFLILISAWIYGTTAMAIEEPSFKVIEKSDPFEIRQYAPTIVAEVIVDGDMTTASSKGFRLIAGYIFGKNNTLPKEPLPSLTTPVESLRTDSSEKIAMTVPVTVEPQEITGSAFESARTWRVQFTMPSQYTLETIPKPTDSSVKLRQVPGKRFAALKYTGLNGEEKVSEKAQLLLNWVSSKNLKPLSPPQLARYNPPWSLPFLRRNEILVEIHSSNE